MRTGRTEGETERDESREGGQEGENEQIQAQYKIRRLKIILKGVQEISEQPNGGKFERKWMFGEMASIAANGKVVGGGCISISFHHSAGKLA